MNTRHHTRTDLARIAADAMRERGLAPEFSQAAQEQAKAIDGPAPSHGDGITDLRALLWCSIDNDDSRDLDQLSACEVLPGGAVKILVAVADVDAFTRDLAGFAKADSVHFDALLHGCVEQAQELDALIVPLLDRKLAEISPIEHGIIWIGAWEFLHCPDVPWRVVLNECIELAKEFGGTDGHKYVNAVLNGLAPTLRTAEVAADRSTGAARA